MCSLENWVDGSLSLEQRDMSSRGFHSEKKIGFKYVYVTGSEEYKSG